MNRISYGTLERDGFRQIERAQSCNLKSTDRISLNYKLREFRVFQPGALE